MKKNRQQLAKDYEAVIQEYLSCKDGVVRDFFNISSLKNLDRKLDMFKKLKRGVPLEKINGWEDLLEKYPRAKKGGTIYW